MFEGQFQLNALKTDLRNVNKCLPFARAFTGEWIARRRIKLSADQKELL